MAEEENIKKMNSRLSMEWDFENNYPYIHVSEKHSLDLRDRVFSSFREKLGHTSMWCKVVFYPTDTPDGVNYNIVPINPKDLKAEAEIILEQARLNNQIPKAPSVSH